MLTLTLLRPWISLEQWIGDVIFGMRVRVACLKSELKKISVS